MALGEHLGQLKQFLTNYSAEKNKASKTLFSNINERAGLKPKQKKPRRGKQLQMQPVLEENEQTDDELDFPKAVSCTEIWHNNEPFKVVFTNDHGNAKKCKVCRMEFPRLATKTKKSKKKSHPLLNVTCVPFDICICHYERYYYPVWNKDKTKVERMEPTKSKKCPKFYCVKKDCLLKHHPYFWNGRLDIDEDVKNRLGVSHIVLLKRNLRYTV